MIEKPNLIVCADNIQASIKTPLPWKNIVMELKIILVKEALIQHNNNQTLAAKALKINRGSFRKILKEGEKKNKYTLRVNSANIRDIVASGTPNTFKSTATELKKELADAVLVNYRGNISRSAIKLGCSRSVLTKMYSGGKHAA